MGSEWGEAGVSGFEDLVERHPDLLIGARADQMQPGALGEGDVQLSIGRPQVDGHRLQHEAEPPLGVGSELTSLWWPYRRPASQPPEKPREEVAEWLEGARHYGRRRHLASHSLTLLSPAQ